MKIVSLTPGTGNFHCGSCLRDHALVKALRQMGHDATMVPMYLPLVTDEAVGTDDAHPIQFGGVNVYLQQKSRLFRGAPRIFDALFNSRWMLNKAAARSGMTHAGELAALTISMLEGEDGFQRKELNKLIGYLQQMGTPDVIVLSNGLLVGLIRQLRERLGAKVIVSLQGEDAFLDTLPDGDRQRAWRLFSERAAEADAIVGPSDYYSRAIQSRLEHTGDRYHTVYNGIVLDGYVSSVEHHAADESGPPVIGYLARMCHGKGLHTLVDAFILLRSMPGCERTRLHIAGAKTAMDDGYVGEQRAKLAAAGLGDEVTWEPNISLERKQALIPTFRAMSVPANVGEAFGLYLLEAMACGVPVVQPRHGAFPELLANTGGGILVEPEDPRSLAEALAVYVTDGRKRAAHGRSARSAVEDRFTHRHMAENFLRVCERSK